VWRLDDASDRRPLKTNKLQSGIKLPQFKFRITPANDLISTYWIEDAICSSKEEKTSLHHHCYSFAPGCCFWLVDLQLPKAW
jgi:hypothetical protein